MAVQSVVPSRNLLAREYKIAGVWESTVELQIACTDSGRRVQKSSSRKASTLVSRVVLFSTKLWRASTMEVHRVHSSPFSCSTLFSASTTLSTCLSEASHKCKSSQPCVSKNWPSIAMNLGAACSAADWQTEEYLAGSMLQMSSNSCTAQASAEGLSRTLASTKSMSFWHRVHFKLPPAAAAYPAWPLHKPMAVQSVVPSRNLLAREYKIAGVWESTVELQIACTDSGRRVQKSSSRKASTLESRVVLFSTKLWRASTMEVHKVHSSPFSCSTLFSASTTLSTCLSEASHKCKSSQPM